MGRKRTLLNAVKVTLNLDKDDYERMKELYPSVGPQVAIRNLIHVHVQQVNAKRVSETESLVKELNLEIEDG